MELNPYLKLGMIFGATSTLCIFLSPILIPIMVGVIIPMIVILIGSLLINSQGTIAFILKSYHKFNVFKLKWIYGTTPENRAHDKLITGQAWNEFCETLKSASSAISNGPQDSLSQAEGYRFLARTVEFITFFCIQTKKLLYFFIDSSWFSSIFRIC